MKNILSALWIILGLMAPLPSAATDARSDELVSQAKQALTQQDKYAFKGFMDQLFEHIAGFGLKTFEELSPFQLPDGLSEAEFIERTCAYDKISEQIFTQELLEDARYQLALLAYLIVPEGKENEVYIRAFTDCVSDDGRPSKTSQFMRDGIAWAKKFHDADAGQALKMAEDMKALAEQNPQIQGLDALAKLVGYDARKQWDAQPLNLKGNEDLTRKYLVGNHLHEERMLEFAGAGHVPTIADAARRYLHGDGVEKSAGTAWYWLKRAQQADYDISEITAKSLAQQLEDMDENERRVLAEIADFHDNLDLTGVDIPPAFGPLTPDIPAPITAQEVEVFAGKFDDLNRWRQKEAYFTVERELVARTAGIHYIGNISMDEHIRPFGMDREEFALRKCNYHRAIVQINPKDRDPVESQLEARHNVLSYLIYKELPTFKDVARFINDIAFMHPYCATPRSTAFVEALKWAEEIDRMAEDDVRRLAEDYFVKSGAKSPDEFKWPPKPYDPVQVSEQFWSFYLAETLRRHADRREQGR